MVDTEGVLAKPIPVLEFGLRSIPFQLSKRSWTKSWATSRGRHLTMTSRRRF